MANEKRLIDANAFRTYLEEVRQEMLEEDTMSSNFAAEVIETVQDEYLQKPPTVDAVEVVRCKDCKEWEYDENFSGWCAMWRRRTLGDHFCSYGERRQE